MTSASPGKDRFGHIAAAVSGFIVATAVSASSGAPIAWATPLYFWFGLPVMAVVIYIIARIWPERPWRWTLSMMLGQVMSSILYGNASLFPVAMAYVTILSMPQFAAGVLGARSALRKRQSGDEINDSQEQDKA